MGKAVRIESVIKSLNKKQLQAVKKPQVPVLMLAGPGTGKTRTLIARIIYQIRKYKIPADQVLALTFSNKAADEMRQRLVETLKNKADAIVVSTIHAFCLNILRKYHKKAGLNPHFSVCNSEYQENLLKSLVKSNSRSQNSYAVKGIAKAIENFVMHNVPLPAYSAMVYEKYCNHLTKHRLLDYNQILTKTLKLFQDNKDIVEQYNFQFQALLVDEFQDTDRVQYQIIRLLACKHQNIFVVADDDQSIYAWRGANPENIRTYMQDFKIKEPLFLDVNYRSGQKIIDVAQSVVKKTDQLEPEKDFKAGVDKENNVFSSFFDSEEQELEFIIKKLDHWRKKDKTALSEMAVLYPQHRFGARLALYLIREQIPFQQAAGHNFSDNPQLKLLTLYLQTLRDPFDALILHELVINELGYNMHTQVQSLQSALKTSYRQALFEMLKNKTVGPDQKAKLSTFIGKIANLINLKTFFSFPELVMQIFNGFDTQERSFLEENSLKFKTFNDAKFLRELKRAHTIWLYHSDEKFQFVLKEICSQLPSTNFKVVTEDASTLKRDVVVLFAPSTKKFNAPVIDLLKKRSTQRESTFTTFLRLIQSFFAADTSLFDSCIVFDLETTGRDPENCAIVEVAAVKVEGGKIVEEFQTLVKPPIPIEPQAEKVHHISMEDVKDAPSWEEVWPKFKEFIGANLLIAHNGYAFDFRIVDRLAKEMDGAKPQNVRYDSLIFARQIYPEQKNSIDALSHRFKLDPGNRHRALDDVIVLHHIFRKIMAEDAARKNKQTGLFLHEAIALALYLENKADAFEDKTIFLSGARKLLSPYSNLLVEFGKKWNYDTEQLAVEMRKKVEFAAPGLLLFNSKEAFKQRILDMAQAITFSNIDRAIAEFLSIITLINPQDKLHNANAVSLLTFHAAKGLEFKKVIIMGMEDQNMPSYFSYKQDENDNRTVEKKMDEQKRLLYVGLTRAKEEVILTAVKNRFGREQKSSPFLREILNFMKEIE